MPDQPAVPGKGTGRAVRAASQYVVVFKDHVRDVPGLARRLAADHGGTILHVYEHALRGFAIRLPEPADRAVARLRAHPDVASVSADGEAQPSAPR